MSKMADIGEMLEDEEDTGEFPGRLLHQVRSFFVVKLADSWHFLIRLTGFS